jgi:hypothetical protein
MLRRKGGLSEDYLPVGWGTPRAEEYGTGNANGTYTG